MDTWTARLTQTHLHRMDITLEHLYEMDTILVHRHISIAWNGRMEWTSQQNIDKFLKNGHIETSTRPDRQIHHTVLINLD